MELLVCEKCLAIVAGYNPMEVTPLPHHKYLLLGKKCWECGHDVMVRRWSFDYTLKEELREVNQGEYPRS